MQRIPVQGDEPQLKTPNNQHQTLNTKPERQTLRLKIPLPNPEAIELCLGHGFIERLVGGAIELC